MEKFLVCLGAALIVGAPPVERPGAQSLAIKQERHAILC